MTRAELITDVRNLIGEASTDTGALLSDAGNLLTFLADAAEQVVLDLCGIMPSQFLTSENVTLVAGTANYTLSNEFLQIWKVERNVTGEKPVEIPIIDPIEMQNYLAEVGDTEPDYHACYFVGNTLYFVPTPSKAVTNYAKVWEIDPEASAVPTAGPTYIPRVAHRLIVYQACAIIATMLERDTTPYLTLYARRLQMVEKVWHGRFQSQTRFVREAAGDRRGRIGSTEDRDGNW
jgi:hypothetical protein